LEEFYVKTTYYAKKGEVQHDWYIVDADGMVLGRLAAQVASILRGKNKPQYTPHVDCGDYVIVINAEKVRLTGNKENQKAWYRYSGYPGGLKVETWKQAMERHPERIIERAVKGMLPKNTLGREEFGKLKVFVGPEHPFQDKNPRKIELEA
jgi:large subunit ribosomal protein L13